MIYIKRVTSADITRQIDLTIESAKFFKFESNSNLSFIDEDSGKVISGELKKTGNTHTITGEIYTEVKNRCELSDIIVFSQTRKDNTYKYYIVNQTSSLYEKFNLSLDLFGSHSSVINKTTHLVALYEGGIPFIGQKIYYGCPGTGKSSNINKDLENIYPNEGERKEYVFRTTFHPDTDYASFVGCYKPSVKNVKSSNEYKSYDELKEEAEIINKSATDKTSQVVKFVTKYALDLKAIVEADSTILSLQNLLNGHFSFSSETYLAKMIEYVLENQEEKITYKFTPQVFTNAYIKAWKEIGKDNPKPVYLVIEEINRGNCAQIFGDLFQLLDRDKKTGISEYSIKADNDLADYLEKVLGVDHEGIKNRELRFPSNLIIYATMNTSDQSLFPMDSAFKRRWDWEYVPIKYANDNWIIEVGQKRYYWVSFQKQVNEKVYNINHSEDKMLGDFFVKADKQDVITESVLLNKILFYLWNDVCKDGEGDIFKKDANTDLTFSDLYGAEGTNNLIAMMTYLGVEEVDDNDIYENDGTNTGKTGNKHAQYSIEGSTKTYRTPKMVQTVIQNYANNHLEMSVQDMIDTWSRISGRTDLLVESYVKSPTDNSKTPRYREIKWDNNTKSVWVVTGWTKELGQAFAEKVKKELGITIEMVN